MRTQQVQQHLRRCGWPISVDGRYGPRTRDAVRAFQRGFAFWRRRLKVDGIVGRRTAKALEFSARHGYRLSPHFHGSEFASRGNGWINVSRYLLRSLEKLRGRVGPIGILSGYRDPAHNASVGGAQYSQHVQGLAIDPGRRLPLGAVRAVRRFSGIGTRAGTDDVLHVDCRHKGPWNMTGGTPLNPTTWTY